MENTTKVKFVERATGLEYTVGGIRALQPILSQATAQGFIHRRVGGEQNGILWEGVDKIPVEDTKEFWETLLEAAGLYGFYRVEESGND